MNVLFVCSRNKLRSPTAEATFAGRADLEVASAGTSPDAEEPVTPELIAWADLIVAMEARHKAALTRQHRGALRGKRVVVLNIPDRFDLFDPELVALLERKVTPLLRGR